MEHSKQPESEHVRRVRYRGTHPHTYQEKYKELHPEQYRQDVERIAHSGHTPAGMHVPICVREILEFLQIQPGQTGLDATLGYGGHTLEMLRVLNGAGHLYAIDVDPIESTKTEERLRKLGYGPEILTIQQRNFAQAEQVSPGTRFDFILADLGVSSMQIDNPDRGFTFKQDGPLDLRMNPLTGVPASRRLLELREPELECLLLENADEPHAPEIARSITAALRRGGQIDTTRQLTLVIENALSPLALPREEIRKSCQRVFQALRIDVNCEFETLYAFLEQLPRILAPGGRIAILTFHSGEDRLVKQAFRAGLRQGLYQDAARDVIRPSPEECRQNSRARPAKLRWAIRAADQAETSDAGQGRR
jgi:16S rRNA (cytosine1402-N4)-methyltransferase